MTTLLLIGGYTPPRGRGQGIALVAHNRRAAQFDLVATTPATSPSALARSGRTVFAVEETSAGKVHSFRLDDTGLSPLSTQESGGADPCHLLVLPSGRHLLTANYSSGSVAAHPIAASGALGPASDVVGFVGSGPVPERQASSHPHHIALRPGTNEIAIADLGADAVHRIRFDEDTGRFRTGLESVQLERGSGPRQVVFAPDGGRAFILGELDSTITLVRWSGAPAVVASVPALREPAPEHNLAATLLMSADSRTLYASHRGADVVAVLAADEDRVRPIIDIPSRGRSPRHIAVDGRWLYVANEVSGSVIALHLDRRDERARIEIPSATFVLPIAGGASA